jgi:HAD superfamily hydrolase (TIGR01509 family)
MKAVLFDVDGVLMYTKRARVQYFRDILVNNGYEDPGADAIRKTWTWTTIDTLRFLTNEKGPKLLKLFKYAQSQGDKIYREDLVTVPKGLRSVLTELKKRYKLGVVTNRTRHDTVLDLRARRMLHYFDVLVTVDDFKKPKPSPEPLNVALKKLGITNTEAVYVGDGKSDYEAARKARIKFIFHPKREVYGRTLVARSFKEIPKLIQRRIWKNVY